MRYIKSRFTYLYLPTYPSPALGDAPAVVSSHHSLVHICLVAWCCDDRVSDLRSRGRGFGAGSWVRRPVGLLSSGYYLDGRLPADR